MMMIRLENGWLTLADERDGWGVLAACDGAMALDGSGESPGDHLVEAQLGMASASGIGGDGKVN